MAGNVVFISYAHEPGEQRDRVLELARALLRAGWDVRLDLYQGRPDGGWPRWMASQVDAADRILCVCTPTYRRRFEGEQARHGLGVSWEGYLITSMLYRERGRSERVIPVWCLPSSLAAEGRSVTCLARGLRWLRRLFRRSARSSGLSALSPPSEDAVDVVPSVLAGLAGSHFDVAALVGVLGVAGPERGEPTLSKGHDVDAMDPNHALGQLYRPIRARSGGAGPLDVPPSTFLRAEHAVVPFHGRGTELAELDGWCRGGDVRVRVVHGVGGAGKTRLALELSARRAREGWRTGPLAPDALTREGAEALVRDPIPLMVYVDYAETRLAEVELLLKQAAANATGPVRVLLLARQVGDWMDILARAVPEWPDLLDIPLQVQGDEQFEVQIAVRAFEDFFRPPRPVVISGSRATPLDAQVDALLAVQGEGGRGVDALASHEEKYLLAAASAWGVRPAVARLLPKAVALATLAQGWAPSEALAWLRAIPEFAAELPADVAQALAVLTAVYPSDDGGVAPVRPDRVGEIYVARQDPEGVLGGVACERGRAVEALTVLTRVARRGGAEAPLHAVLTRHQNVLSDAIDAVAIAESDPVGRRGAEMVDTAEKVQRVGSAGVRVARKEAALRQLIDAGNRLFVVDAENGDEATLADRAGYLNTIATRLLDIGRPEEATEATAEAVALFRQLASVRPDAFKPDLARSLNTLGRALSEIDQFEEALSATAEGVALFRQLALFSPEAFEPDLATSLNYLGIRLSESDRREEALAVTAESVSMYRHLASVRPGTFESDLARSLNNIGFVMSSVGLKAEALEATREAVALRRKLVSINPHAFESDLALGLINLGNRLSGLGRLEEGLEATAEAVALLRGLASVRPDAFEPELARSLNNLGIQLAKLERREEALVVTEDATRILRRLALARPGDFEPDLAMSLNNLGNRLLALGRRKEALGATSDLVSLRRRLASLRPDVFEPDLAAGLHNLAYDLSALGRHEEALAAAEEAVDLRRRLAWARPEEFLPSLAGSLNNLGNRLMELGRREEALAATGEAVDVWRRLAELRPNAFLSELSTSLGAMGQVLAAMSCYADSAAAFAEGLGYLLPVVRRLPQSFADLAEALATDHLAACQSAAIEPNHALLAQFAETLGNPPTS